MAIINHWNHYQIWCAAILSSATARTYSIHPPYTNLFIRFSMCHIGSCNIVDAKPDSYWCEFSRTWLWISLFGWYQISICESYQHTMYFTSSSPYHTMFDDDHGEWRQTIIDWLIGGVIAARTIYDVDLMDSGAIDSINDVLMTPILQSTFARNGTPCVAHGEPRVRDSHTMILWLICTESIVVDQNSVQQFWVNGQAATFKVFFTFRIPPQIIEYTLIHTPQQP